MIVGMTKYTFLIYHKEYETFLEQMREIGVLHVIQKQSGAPEEGSQLQEKIALAQRYEKALKEINNHLSGDFAKCQPERTGEDAISLIAEMESLNEKKTKLALHQIALEKEIDRVGPWGDFTWDSVNKLRDAGFIIRFWSCSERNFDQIGRAHV